MPSPRNLNEERRRSPRSLCGCDATISRFPSDGKFFPGKILNLSRGGCCIDTSLALFCGTRIEIVARAKGSTFRVVGDVRAVWGGSKKCIAFVRLCAGAEEIFPAYDLTGNTERTNTDDDRRRSSRFACGGHAKISCLPSNGIFHPGKIRDLSLGGCYVDGVLPIDCGERAEIVVRVNAASFRAVGEVRALRGQSGAGIEFVQLSAGGKEMLADLIAELSRLQAVMNELRSARREMDAESYKKQLVEGKLQAAMLSEQIPMLRTILQAENTVPGRTVPNGKDRKEDTKPLEVLVDLFG
jgi:hypothetical protein